jgi:tetratricopeptide (TPR) repeat protein
MADTMQGATNDDECRKALSRVLASDIFVRADRLQNFLTYIVEETLAGRGDLIRGKTIAMDVHGRDLTTNGQSENVVRVDARRLRRSLAEYYTTEGKDDPVRIWVDSGGYVPRVEIRQEKPSESPSGWSGKILAGAAIVILAVGLAVAIYFWISPNRTEPEQDAQAILERQALLDKSPATLQAVNLAEQAREFLFPLLEPERQRIATDMFRQAIRLDPDYFGGYAGAAQTLTTLSKMIPPGPQKDETRAEALRMAETALQLNPTHSWTQSAAGWAAFGNREFERAFELSSRAENLNPEDGHILDFHGMISLLTGHFEEALKASDPTRTRKSAKQRLANRSIFGVASIHLGRYEDAIASFHSAAELGEPISALSLVYQAAGHQALGKSELASGFVQELAATWPDFRPEIALPNFYQHREHAEQILDHLRAAGWVPGN